MKNHKLLLASGVVILALAIAPLTLAPAQGRDDDDDDSESRILAESALLTSLESQSVFPFIDTTPNKISRAHIAITDSTTACAPRAAPPANMEVLVGEAGVALVPVMGPETNTGIGTPRQCVFHVTVTAGRRGIPRTVTDIVVLNNSAAPLTGVNTVTASAEVGED